MSLKNLNVSKKTHKFLLDKLKDSRTLQIYKKFESNLPIKKNFVVAVSGGPDSLALSFFAFFISRSYLLSLAIDWMLLLGLVSFQVKILIFIK